MAKELFIQLLRKTGHARMKVFGCSMLPAIRPEDVIRVESGPVNPGDIIVFERAGHLCVHRLLTTVDSQAIARGDANPGVDTPFPYTGILGRVTSLERNGTVVKDLKFRLLFSLIIRNSQIACRIFLHIHNKPRISAGSKTSTATSRLAKLQG